MFRMRCYILLTLCWLLSASAMAQVGEKMSFELRSDGDGNYRLDFVAGDFAFSRSDEGYMYLVSDGMISLAPGEGMPALPQVSRLVALPRGTEMRVEGINETETEPVHLPSGLLLAPWRGAAVKDAGPVEVEPDKVIYATDSFMRWGNPVEVENLGVMGGKQMFRITVHPVVYNPASGEVSICTEISATLLTTGLAVPTCGNGFPQRYLIVSRPQFQDGLRPFVQWKRQEGFDVVEVYADTNQRDSVKAQIAPYFETDPPRYMLIVGDAAQIQAYIGTTRPSGLGTHPTDLYYAEHTGDYLPDAIVGRWPVNDTAELRAVVEKTLRYEQGLGLDTAALNRVLLIAGHENTEPAPVTTNGQVNYLKQVFAGEGLDTICYYNPASGGQIADIVSDISDGVGMLNYTAHCTTAGWTSPALSFTTLDTLETPMPMLYVNNCCLSNSFTGTCFGEQLIRKAQGGGVGVIGATNSTLWNEDYYWAVGPKYPFSLEPVYDSLRQGAFDRMTADSNMTAGELLVAGNLAVSAFGSPHDRFYWEIYCLFGDPALVPWRSVPQQVVLSVPDTLVAGVTELRVSGTPGALVSAVQGDSLIGVVRLDEHRSKILRLYHPLDTVPVLFTATKARMLPAVDTVPIVMPTGKALTFANVALCDSVARFTMVNVGTDTLYGLVATALVPDDGDEPYLLFESVQYTLDTLPPAATCAVSLPLTVNIWAPQLVADMTVTDHEGDFWRLRRSLRLVEPLPELRFSIADAGGEPTAQLVAPMDALVGAVATGVYDSIDVTVTALPDGTATHGVAGWLPVSLADGTTHLRIDAYVGHGFYGRNYEYYLNVGGNTDGFGNGMEAYPWQSGGTLPWIVDSTMSHSGRYSLRSGAIDYRQTSVLNLDVLLPNDDSIAFWLRTSSEPTYDKLVFSIDGVKACELWGQSDWRHYAYPLSAGYHSLQWRYSKDESTSQGSDCAWLDDVRLPLALWSEMCGQGAGDNGPSGIAAPRQTTLAAYPNPTNGRVRVESDGRIESLRLMDIYGRTVYAATPSTLAVTLDLDELSDGLYIIVAYTAAGITYTKLNLQHR